ncbi:serine/threonine protein kinase [Burkholderia multivorans]|nr:serine/threonine protein kinase [Burkholderia multivorans]PRH07034.1 serine/threonine protein kinase [Burkholderia multivorans]
MIDGRLAIGWRACVGKGGVRNSIRTLESACSASAAQARVDATARGTAPRPTLASESGDACR